MTKGFKDKNKKFHPTEKRNKSSLKKKDVLPSTNKIIDKDMERNLASGKLQMMNMMERNPPTGGTQKTGSNAPKDLKRDKESIKNEKLDSDDFELYEVSWHEERDNAQVFVTNRLTDETVYENFDPKEISELIEDGFVKHFGDDESLLKHLNNVGIVKHIDTFEEADKRMKEYFEGFNWKFIKNEIKRQDKMKYADFDPDAMVSQEEGDKEIQVLFIAENSDVGTDDLGLLKNTEGGQSAQADYLFYGKGQDIIDKHLPEITAYSRDVDFFLVSGL